MNSVGLVKDVFKLDGNSLSVADHRSIANIKCGVTRSATVWYTSITDVLEIKAILTTNHPCIEIKVLIFLRISPSQPHDALGGRDTAKRFVEDLILPEDVREIAIERPVVIDSLFSIELESIDFGISIAA